MSRLKSDILLALAALIWGVAFVFQKDAAAHLGPFTFIAARFVLSALAVLPVARREGMRSPVRISRDMAPALALLCGIFFTAAVLQQAGVAETTVANAGFLTGLYVVFTPVICWLAWRQRLSALVFPAAFLSVAGVWMLSGMQDGGFVIGRGDMLVLLCALAFAAHIALVGRLLARTPAPCRLACLQYAAVAALAFIAALFYEHTTLHDLQQALPAILYAGLFSGGIAYTLQMVAQTHAPAADSAIILSSESVFAALAGVAMTGERLTAAGYAGCALILAAILLVEFGPIALKRRSGVAELT